MEVRFAFCVPPMSAPIPKISLDIESSEEHGTFDYALMREQIRKYKGLLPDTDKCAGALLAATK